MFTPPLPHKKRSSFDPTCDYVPGQILYRKPASDGRTTPTLNVYMYLKAGTTSHYLVRLFSLDFDHFIRSATRRFTRSGMPLREKYVFRHHHTNLFAKMMHVSCYRSQEYVLNESEQQRVIEQMKRGVESQKLGISGVTSYVKQLYNYAPLEDIDLFLDELLRHINLYIIENRLLHAHELNGEDMRRFRSFYKDNLSFLPMLMKKPEPANKIGSGFLKGL